MLTTLEGLDRGVVAVIGLVVIVFLHGDRGRPRARQLLAAARRDRAPGCSTAPSSPLPENTICWFLRNAAGIRLRNTASRAPTTPAFCSEKTCSILSINSSRRTSRDNFIDTWPSRALKRPREWFRIFRINESPCRYWHTDPLCDGLPDRHS